MIPAKSTFREDINGLRALAVIAVVLFHFSPERLPGGFAGVDVFFVISGYLMTSIIFRGFEGGGFSFWRFAISRAKRILPALLAVTLILMLLGYATLGADAYKMLARHVRDSLLFVSNITYEKESGYFDVASNTKFLLHTWSLSVEWQFYIIYPLILMALKRFLSISALKIAVMLMLVISLISSIYITAINPDKAYFMFYTRSWEMLFGGVAYLYPLRLQSDKLKFGLEAIGLSLIAIAIFKIKPTTPWPGYIALLPVLGTYMCILANNRKTILSGFLIGYLGLWSYSIYLVHWPLLVFDHALNWGLSFKEYLAITLVLAFMLYQLVEKRRGYKWGLLVLFIMVLSSAIYVRKTDGMEQRFSVPDEISSSIVQAHKGWKSLVWIDNNKHLNAHSDYVFFGDSFTAQYESFFKNENIFSSFLYSGECLSTPKYYSNWEICSSQYGKLRENKLHNDFKTLVISIFWNNAMKDFRSKENNKKLELGQQTFIKKIEDELVAIKSDLDLKNIVIIGEHNRFQGPHPKECFQKLYESTLYQKYIENDTSACIDVAAKDSKVTRINSLLREMSDNYGWLYFINPNEVFCENGQCTQIRDDGRFLHGDEWHLSVTGAEIAGKHILDELRKIDETQKAEESE